MMRNYYWTLAAWVASAAGMAGATESGIVFEDVTAAAGLAEYLEASAAHAAWRYAHGAGWGDADGDGRPDLYLGAFAARRWYENPAVLLPNMLLLNGSDRFRLAEGEAIQFRQGNARCAGVLFADLDRDGDLDLVVANHVLHARCDGTRLFENLGVARFRDVTPQTPGWPARLGVRTVSAIDCNHDGQLDLLFADDTYGRQARAQAKLIVLENRGRFRFAEVSAELGLPQQGTPGLGLAIGDVNEDGRSDIFVAGSNRLLVSRSGGTYREAHPGRFAVPTADRREGWHCGAAFGDLDGDGLLDLVTTEHGVPARIHIFANRGVQQGIPELVEVTEATGLDRLFPTGTRENPIKAAHVALRDLDHDGRIDILLTVVYRDRGGRLQPVVLRNLTPRAGPLRFSTPPYERMVGYYVAGPVADFDGDGRVDLFLASWFEDLPNCLLRNVTPCGNWLGVRVTSNRPELNTMGIGGVVRAYKVGHLGQAGHLLGRTDIVVGTGYASSEEAAAHLGLGQADECDLEVRWQGHMLSRRNVPANQWLTVAFE